MAGDASISQSSIFQPFAAICVVAVLIKYCIHWLSKSKQLPFPPGPEPKFLIGNMNDIPNKEGGKHYLAWGKQYNSDILHASALGTHFVILNSFKDAEELLEKRASNYSSRPIAPVTKLMGWEKNMALMAMGDEWRRHRRVAQQGFRQDAIRRYHPILLEKVHKMLLGLAETPENVDDHNRMLSLSISMAILYGHNVASLEDPFIEAAKESTDMALKLVQPGYTLINVLPFLKYIPHWFPGASAQKMAYKTKLMAEDLRTSPVETVKKQLKMGTALPSIIASCIETEEAADVAGDVAFTIYIGASDTTVSATTTFLYLLATHPEVQARAQKELDTVIGSGRLPTFEDRASLPYLEAVYREMLRWRPPATLGFVHCSAEDDIYKGYYIPKGSLVLSNVWAMSRNEEKYPDPETFRAERFLNADGSLNDDSRVLTYGFGRRICVGKHLASASVWITMASVLATFNVSKAKDEQGNEIEIDDVFEDEGIINHKTPFKCNISPRSDEAIRMINEANKQYR